MIRLKELRQEANLTQIEFAKIFNLKQGTYSNYENETTQPDLKVLIQIADYYGVSLDYLVGRVYVSDVGYLTKDEKQVLKIYRELNSVNQLKYIAQGEGLIISQN